MRAVCYTTTRYRLNGTSGHSLHLLASARGSGVRGKLDELRTPSSISNQCLPGLGNEICIHSCTTSTLCHMTYDICMTYDTYSHTVFYMFIQLTKYPLTAFQCRNLKPVEAFESREPFEIRVKNGKNRTHSLVCAVQVFLPIPSPDLS